MKIMTTIVYMRGFHEFNNSKTYPISIAISVGLEGVICLVHLYPHNQKINKINNVNYVNIVYSLKLE